MRQVTANPARMRIGSVSRARRTAGGPRHRLVGSALVSVAILVLAACGSSSSSSSSKSKSTSSTAARSSSAAVKTATGSTFGTILVDSNGKTVYTLTKAGQAVPCSGGCLNFWPPVIAPAGGTASAAGVSGLGTVAATGGQQVTYTGLPLYTFSQDHAAGDATGDGVSSFGGTWHVVKIASSAGASTSGGGGSATTTTTKARRGYGY